MLWRSWPLLLLSIKISQTKVIDSEMMTAIKELKINGEQYKRVENLHLNMYIQAMQSLIGAVGRETYKKLKPERCKQLRLCLENVEDYDLQSGAHCIVNAWSSKFKQQMVEKQEEAKLVSPFKTVDDLSDLKKSTSPRLLRYQNKTRIKRSHTTWLENKDENRFRPVQMDSAPPLSSKYKDESLVSASAKLFLRGMNLLKNKSSSITTESLMNLQKLQQLIEIEWEARRYKRSLVDIVLDRRGKQRRRTKASDRIRTLLVNSRKKSSSLMNNLLNLMDTFEKYNQKLNYKFLSPKFASIMQNKREDLNQSLSPNLFPLYKDENAVLPVPELLEKIGLNERERDAFINLIVEASGASKLVDDTMQLFRNNKTRALNDEINNVTLLIQRRIQEMHSTLHDDQQKDMQKQGFTFLNRPQLEMLYGPKGLTTTVPFDMDEYEKWSRVDLKRSLMNAVRSIAQGQPIASANFSPKRLRSRFKRGAPESIIVGGSTMAAPFIFAPEISEVSILGPVLISPSLFSPAILSPNMLSPVVLSPSVGNPMILSPYVLSPKILSAEIFAVYILNPYLLSPNILNPFVLSPLILSPHLMCPDILSPTVASGIVLNPYALSPAILTESAFVFDILSPSFLS